MGPLAPRPSRSSLCFLGVASTAGRGAFVVADATPHPTQVGELPVGTHRERSKWSPSQLGVTQPSRTQPSPRTADCGRPCLRSVPRPPALQKSQERGQLPGGLQLIPIGFGVYSKAALSLLLPGMALSKAEKGNGDSPEMGLKSKGSSRGWEDVQTPYVIRTFSRARVLFLRLFLFSMGRKDLRPENLKSGISPHGVSRK